jgi:hypothetical protein
LGLEAGSSKKYSRSGLVEEAAKLANNTGGQFAKSLLGKKVVACAVDLEEGVRGRDQFQGGFHFGDCSERIACAVDEKSGLVQLREVGSAKLIRFLGRMQGVREKQQTIDEPRIF